MFPETSRSPRYILPPVIYEVPETSPLYSSAPLVVPLFTMPFAALFQRLLCYYTRRFLSFCPFFIVLPVAPGFRLLALVERHYPFPLSHSFFLPLALLADLFSKTSRPFSLFLRSFRPSFSAGKNSGALTIPDRQTRPAYSPRA